MKHILILLATLQGLAILVGAQQYGRPCTQTSHGRDCRDNADSETSAASAPVRQCPPGRVYAGEVRDKDGKLTGYHCVKDVSSQPMSFPPQQQGIPIGNAPISIGNASDGGYVSPGSVSPASSTADLLNPSLRKDSMKQKPGCAELIAYRDGQLMHDLGVAIDKKTIYDQGKLAALDQAKDVLDLMNKEWYFGKTGAEIVIHVKLATDEVKAILKMFLPAEGVIDNFLEGLAGRELQKLPQTFAEEYQPIVESTDVRVGLIKTWNEEGAKKAVGEAGKEIAWTIGEELSPVVGMEHGVLTYADNQEKMEKSEEVIQEQVGKLVRDARSWHAKEEAESYKMIYYEGIRDKITAYCSTEPQDGPPIPKL